MKKILLSLIFLLPLLLFGCEQEALIETTTTETQPLEIIDTSNLILSENYTSVSVNKNTTQRTLIHGVVREVGYSSAQYYLYFEGGDKYCAIDDEPEENIDNIRLLTLDALGVRPIIYFTTSTFLVNKKLNYCEIKYIRINELLFKYDNLNYVTNINWDFRENKINANNKYIGKSIGILDNIVGVEYVKFEDQELPTVIIESFIEIDGVKINANYKINCYLSSEEEAIKLKRGSAIVIAGIFKSYIENEKGSDSHIKPCKVLDVTK